MRQLGGGMQSAWPRPMSLFRRSAPSTWLASLLLLVGLEGAGAASRNQILTRQQSLTLARMASPPSATPAESRRIATQLMRAIRRAPRGQRRAVRDILDQARF